jgi:cardiolipin synthase
VFAIGGFTDFFDGLLARRLNQQTALGAYLDPIADKLLVFSSYVMLGAIGGIPAWLAVVVIARDLLILVGYAAIYFLVEERMQARPSWIGKWSTTFQLLTLAIALVILHDPKLIPAMVLQGFVWLTAAATIASGLQYLYRGLVWLQNHALSIKPPS